MPWIDTRKHVPLNWRRYFHLGAKVYVPVKQDPVKWHKEALRDVGIEPAKPICIPKRSAFKMFHLLNDAKTAKESNWRHWEEQFALLDLLIKDIESHHHHRPHLDSWLYKPHPQSVEDRPIWNIITVKAKENTHINLQTSIELREEFKWIRAETEELKLKTEWMRVYTEQVRTAWEEHQRNTRWGRSGSALLQPFAYPEPPPLPLVPPHLPH